MTPLIPLSPAEVAARLKSGAARLIDIREPDEYARDHVVGALTAPLSAFEAADLSLKAGQGEATQAADRQQLRCNGSIIKQW